MIGPADPPLPSDASDRSRQARLRMLLFDSEGMDRVVQDEADLTTLALEEHRLLWIDLQGDDDALLDRIAVALGIPAAASAAMRSRETSPSLHNCGGFFWARTVAVDDGDGIRFQGSVLTVLAGENLVISLHRNAIPFIDAITTREAGETALGRLTSSSFMASLLDWQLSTYFEAASRFDLAVDRLENAILADRDGDSMAELRELRAGASRLRRMLAPHRVVFGGMARPDFRPQESGAANRHFVALDERFERAMDIVENARELVTGSFGLFSSRMSLRTNQQMQVLTFATVVIGVLAVLAGVLGMNFDAPFFRSAGTGFWTAVSCMALLTIGSAWLGRRRRWF
ncbi:magnesium transporter CorA family protein [Arenimonas sp.]|uniref:magnesium transporter CorA family protein n=1 Tax=Arenimonas sp. TaxID=1872635 RepID=UPI0039E547D8